MVRYELDLPPGLLARPLQAVVVSALSFPVGAALDPARRPLPLGGTRAVHGAWSAAVEAWRDSAARHLGRPGGGRRSAPYGDPMAEGALPPAYLWQSTPRESRDFSWSDAVPDRRGRGGCGHPGHLRGQPGSALLRRRPGRLRHRHRVPGLRGRLPLCRLGVQPAGAPLPAPRLAGALLLEELPAPADGRTPLGPRLPRLPDLPAGPRPGPLDRPTSSSSGGWCWPS
jgi:hypothetical protein